MRLVSVSLAALVACLAGCGSGEDAETVRSADAEVTRSAEAAMSRDALCWTLPGHGSAGVVDTLADVLPNTLFKEVGSPDPPAPLTPLVVVGRVVDVTAGRAWAAPNSASDEHQGGPVIPFDDRRAMWKVVHATVEVEEILGSADGMEPAQVLVLSPSTETSRWSLPLTSC